MSQFNNHKFKVRSFLIILSGFSFIGSLFINATKARAATCPDGQVNTEFGCSATVGDYVTHILGSIIPIIGGVALLMFIYAGFLYMTSQGSQDKISLAKEIMIGTIVGILLLFLIGILLTEIGTV